MTIEYFIIKKSRSLQYVLIHVIDKREVFIKFVKICRHAPKTAIGLHHFFCTFLWEKMSDMGEL